MSSGHMNELRQIWKRGGLLPVLGAGMSIQSNLPSWDGLLMQMMKYLLSNHKLDDSLEIDNISTHSELIDFLSQQFSALGPIVSVRYLKNLMADRKEFSHAVYNALYYQLINDPEPSDNVIALTRLASHSCVFLSYNFDNVLDLAFRKQGIPCQAIYSEEQEPAENTIIIYHPHGYLPYGDEIVWDKRFRNNPIILSEDEYHDQYIDPFSWSNAIQIKCLYEHTLLLLGLSANDPNLRRVLEIASRHASRKHYIVLKAEKQQGPYYMAWQQLQSIVLQQLGLKAIWLGEYDEIQQMVSQIIS